MGMPNPPGGDGSGWGERGSYGDRGPRGEHGPRGERGRRGERGDREERGPQTVKSRLRAKARKKARKQQRKLFQRRKVSRFTMDKTVQIDYKDAKVLRGFLSETGKIIPRRISGNTASQQRTLAQAIKRARQLALLPYADHHQ